MQQQPHLRIALVTLNAHGHFRPLFGLGRRILQNAADGDVKVLLTVPCSPETVLAEAEYPEIEVERILLPPQLPNVAMAQMHYVFQNEDVILKAAIEMFERHQINVVLYDPFASWGHAAGDAINAKSYAICTSPLSCYYLWLINECFVTNPGTAPTVKIPGIGDIPREAIPDTLYLAPFFKSATERIHNVNGVICNDSPIHGEVFELVDVVKDLLKKCTGGIHILGYFADIPKVSTKDTPEIQWLDQQEPDSVIYIALGSWCPLAFADVVELAEGLAATGSKFLWALRDPEVAASFPPPHAPPGYKAREPTVEVEKNGLPVGFRERVEGRGMILRWVNQTAVLAHPAIKMFVTHCGWNSLTEAARLCPKPLALLPLMAEQDLNAHVIQNVWKVGKTVWGHPPFRQLEREAVSARLTEIANDEELKVTAAQMYAEQLKSTESMSLRWKQLLAELANQVSS